MITNQIIEKTIRELHAICKAQLAVYDISGELLVATGDEVTATKPATIEAFALSEADSQSVGEIQLKKVLDEGEVAYVVAAKGSGVENYLIAQIACHELASLIIAYKDKVDKNSFMQNLLLDNLLLVDIYNQAKKLHVEVECNRAVYVLKTRSDRMNAVTETLRSLYSTAGGDYITSVEEGTLILVKHLQNGDSKDELMEIANMISDMMNTEAMADVRIAYGTQVTNIKNVSKSYKEALTAMEVGHIFYPERKIVPYSMLGIGRLIYQLPVNLCRIFVEEIFGTDKLVDLDDETLLTVRRFLENSQNVSETSRQLYIHRNTLIHRIERIQKMTGLDIRIFNEAMTLQIALMVVNYMKYLESMEG